MKRVLHAVTLLGLACANAERLEPCNTAGAPESMSASPEHCPFSRCSADRPESQAFPADDTNLIRRTSLNLDQKNAAYRTSYNRYLKQLDLGNEWSRTVRFLTKNTSLPSPQEIKDHLGASLGIALPSSPDPDEFQRQVVNFVVLSAQDGAPVGGPERRDEETTIRNGLGAWEPALADLIANPETHGVRASLLAFQISQIRETVGDSLVVRSLIKLLDFLVQDASRKIEEITAKGEAVPYHVTVPLKSFTASILRIGQPELLEAVLLCLNSESEKVIGQVKGYTPVEVANALRDYGDSRHLRAAGDFVMLLKASGKDDIATEISRELVRIKARRPDRFDSRNQSRLKDSDLPGKGGLAVKEGDKHPRGIIAFFGLLILLGFGSRFWRILWAGARNG